MMDALPLPAALDSIADKLRQNRPISETDAQTLFHHPDILEVAALANSVSVRKWQGVAHYQTPLRISLARYCEGSCRLCQVEENPIALVEKTPPAEIHLLPGPTPAYTIGFCEDTLRALRQRLSAVWIAGFSPQSVYALSQQSAVTPEETVSRLQAAGLDALLGSDEENFTRAGRGWLSAHTLPTELELRIHQSAHRCGLVTTAGLRYSADDTGSIVSRLATLREIQRQTAGFTVFAPVAASVNEGEMTDYLDLRITALSRLFLDNIPHIRVPWMALGLKMGQVALSFGGDDLGWAALDPHVRKYAPPTSFLGMSESELQRAVTAVGLRAARVDGAFRRLEKERSGLLEELAVARNTPDCESGDSLQ